MCMWIALANNVCAERPPNFYETLPEWKKAHLKSLMCWATGTSRSVCCGTWHELPRLAHVFSTSFTVLFTPPHYKLFGEGEERVFYCVILDRLLGLEFYPKMTWILNKHKQWIQNQTAWTENRQWAVTRGGPLTLPVNLGASIQKNVTTISASEKRCTFSAPPFIIFRSPG